MNTQLPMEVQEPAIVMVTGSCCDPSLKPLEEETERLTRQAIAESGVPTTLQVMSGPAAARGGVPLEVVRQLQPDPNAPAHLPAVLVAGEVVSAGAPDADAIRAALARLANPSNQEI